MSFTSYLVQPFATSHENIFFRNFAHKLADKYTLTPGEHVLVANFSCQGHQVDALFIAKGKIIVIDFKDYEGKLTFSENNPWKLKTKEKDDLVFVAGGANSRNPFQQVNAYRFALMNYVSANEKEVADANHTTLNWSHITCLVLFQRKIDFDASSIPAKITRYFQIADNATIYPLLDDLYTKSLELTDNEIHGLLRLLTISAINRYDPNQAIPEVVVPKHDQSKLLVAENLLKDAVKETRYQNILQYYITLLTIERQNEPNISNKARYNIEWQKNLNTYNLNLSENPSFIEAWQKNSKEKFPQNLFIGLNIDIEGRDEPVLNTVILHADVTNSSQVIVNLDDFSIYTKIFENFKLPEDIIDVLVADVNKVDTLEEKLKCINEILSTTVKITSSLTVAFSSETLYSAQLISELRKLKEQEGKATPDSLFYNFVVSQAVPPVKSTISQELIQISPLNENQQNAVIPFRVKMIIFDHELTLPFLPKA